MSIKDVEHFLGWLGSYSWGKMFGFMAASLSVQESWGLRSAGPLQTGLGVETKVGMAQTY